MPEAQRKKGGSQSWLEVDQLMFTLGYIVASGGKDDGLLLECIAMFGQLTKAGIRAAFLRQAKPKLLQQFRAAEEVPITVILGPAELATGSVRFKVLNGKVSDADGDA